MPTSSRPQRKPTSTFPHSFRSAPYGEMKDPPELPEGDRWRPRVPGESRSAGNDSSHLRPAGHYPGSASRDSTRGPRRRRGDRPDRRSAPSSSRLTPSANGISCRPRRHRVPRRPALAGFLADAASSNPPKIPQHLESPTRVPDRWFFKSIITRSSARSPGKTGARPHMRRRSLRSASSGPWGCRTRGRTWRRRFSRRRICRGRR
jgi:hypothetical protein